MYTKRMSRISRLSQRSSIAMYFSNNDQQDGDAPPLPSLEDVWNNTYGLGTSSVSSSQQHLPTSSSQASNTSSVSSSPAIPSSSNSLYNHRNSSNPLVFNNLNPNSSASAAHMSNRDQSDNYTSTVSLEEKTLPPVPGQRSGSQQPSNINKRTSNMSIQSGISNRVSQPDFQNTLTTSNNTSTDLVGTSTPAPASNEIPDGEEEFMELFKREQSGPSR